MSNPTTYRAIDSTEVTSYDWTQLADVTVPDPSSTYNITYSLNTASW